MGRVRVTAIVSYVGEQYYDNDQSTSFGRKMPEYTVVDVAASLDQGNWRLSAPVRNLMNEHYYIYAIRSVTAPTFNAYPAPERSLFRRVSPRTLTDRSVPRGWTSAWPPSPI
jgi:outer membrane receptor for ferrienterochelin and colicin